MHNNIENKALKLANTNGRKKWVGKMKNTLSSAIHPIITLILFLLHCAVVVHYTAESLHHLLPQGVVGLLYIIVMSIIWILVIRNYFNNANKKLQDEIERCNIEIIILKEDKDYLIPYKNHSHAYGKNIAPALSEIQELQRFISCSDYTSANIDDTLGLMQSYVGKFCEQVMYAFKEITKSQDISVCIKIIHGDADKNTTEASSVTTLIRDFSNFTSRNKDGAIKHPINKNTAYKKILKRFDENDLHRPFFDNNLAILKDYENTSFPLYGQEKWNENLTNEDRIKLWKMPYFSTIIGGIYPISSKNKGAKYLSGYICIDSSKIDAFSFEEHTKIVNILGDMLYNTIKDLRVFTTLAKKHKDKIKDEISKQEKRA